MIYQFSKHIQWTGKLLRCPIYVDKQIETSRQPARHYEFVLPLQLTNSDQGLRKNPWGRQFRSVWDRQTGTDRFPWSKVTQSVSNNSHAQENGHETYLVATRIVDMLQFRRSSPDPVEFENTAAERRPNSAAAILEQMLTSSSLNRECCADHKLRSSSSFSG